ncbi:hypothetical protein AAG747_27035 [Rapidithrix thailandica]|uniref:Outer membrane protein beta-barrel domain-containing protein n=1 Tax=Rapidithrix thailandica TaxID=413964 RepID=A0AAW9SGZ8_9BACT
MLYRVLIGLLILLTCQKVLGQEKDSVFIRNDTTYIIKKTVVVTKKVYVEDPEEPPVKKVKKSTAVFLMPYVQTSYSLDYISVCKLKRNVYDQIDGATTPQLNYTLGGEMVLRKNKFLFAIDIGYTLFREKFTSSGIESSNKQQVLTASVDFGYLLMSYEKSLDIFLRVGAGYMYTLSYSGNTFDPGNPSNVISLQSQNTFDKSSVIANGKLLGVYHFNEQLAFVFGPTYSTNLLSITQKDIFYDKWRNNVGFMLGLSIELGKK